ncbi:nucleoside triphosphate pyrophosphohydrolase [Sutcliffiella sp. NC1]|uniref:nucleoside triphosphate pyrophosphohydrolase n=1 Tax=Sutcliffiella sp. NC1 TaxID=3004096 RepID=UPI0022DDF8FD|nr:nucleoside triphosphate pyrophosphohydrolase [Sutcliffiella sp. NC1]WBL15191.1 nucleoside triphosphate pyrophosphohydrolase [Sutcliffiella sp. NC1]
MKRINIVGLGAGDLNQLPLGIYKHLKNSQSLYLRTSEHPVLKELEQEGLSFESFDYLYEEHEQFEQVYEAIVQVLLQKSSENDEITYAVPGHPLVAERTVQLLLEEEKRGNIAVEIIGGQSFLDPMFSAIGLDPIDGFQLLDATSLNRDDIQLSSALIIGQVYDAYVASEVKLTLMELLPDDYTVYLVTGAGTSEEKIVEVPLYELDRVTTLNNLTSVYVPKVEDRALLNHQFASFRATIATLRGPNGCPWDKEQTHESLKKYLIEEAYELIDAINGDDIEGIIEELGDVLLQVMLHSQIGEDDGYFSIDDVIQTINEKMIRRHPHVFAKVEIETADDVVTNWEAIKKEEKKERQQSNLLDTVSESLPALSKAFHYQKKAAKVGFDWGETDPIWDKIYEELKELQEEWKKGHHDLKVKEEFGDLLFALINIGRYYKIDPEDALTVTNHKFYNRFSYIEGRVKELKKDWDEFSLEQLDAFWNEAKKLEK